MSISRPRSTSVTFVRSRTSSRPDDIPEFRSEDEDDIQITLAAPYIQTYLAYTSRGLTCCGISLPIPFERSSQKSWWDPRFDSEILEGQYKLSAFSHLRLRFRYALFYILLVSISWLIYFFCTNVKFEGDTWKIECEILGVFIGIILVVLSITHFDFYRSNVTITSLFVAISLCLLSLCCVFFIPVSFSSEGTNFTPNISPIGHTAICIQVLLLIYTVIPLPLYLCVSISATYSTIFEMLIFLLHDHSFISWNIGIVVRILAQTCVHLVGVHIFIMNNVRMRGTFMKVGQSLLVRRQLEMEKQLKEKMIHSVMPPRVADWLMAETGEFETNTASKNALPRNSNPGASDLKSLFRPFNMNRMENVSILFADIVGFTKMSSNKTAEELVGILNDLFERFDDLCTLNNCEKISTLGDCYYCVSGCPEPRSDHAKCCVEMGLGMIQAIAQFDMERNEGVNMRVGIHTGTVLCGIVGTRRFKFDVWSNDVTLANRMESTGKPGRVHISERTCDYLQNMYILEDAEPVCGLQTYFIIKRVSDIENEGSSEKQSDSCDPGVQLIISPPIIAQIPSQVQSSVLSGETSHNLLKPRTHLDQLTPNVIRIKANSLPSILDSETECDADQKDALNETDDSSRSPTSTGSYGKYSNKIKNWRVPKFLFKGDGDKIKVDIECGKISPKDDSKLQVCNGYQQVPTESQPNQRQKFDISPIGSVGSTNDRPKGNGDNKNDILDIKSYISQSRSDIGHFDRSPTDFIRTSSCKSHHSRPSIEGFERANSCRSQCGRSQNCQVPVSERGRSATVVCRTNTENLEVPNAIAPPDDQLSLCLSVNSRKDSGIRSTSRRSSIQQQIFALNQAAMSQGDILQHRVSGYYTSSQSSIATNSQHCTSQLPPPFSDHLGACVQKLRKQSDLQLIRCVQDNTTSKRSYFIKPPLSKFTLFFKSREMESDYRRNVHTITEKLGESIPTLATARYNTLFDVLVSALIFLLISFSLFLLYFPTNQWLCIFFTFFVIETCAIYLCVRQVLSYPNQIFKIFSMWYVWHIVGAILVSIPVISILVNFSCANINIRATDFFYNILILISLIHFCNFTQLNCWMKNVLATIYAITFIILIHTSQCYNVNFLHLTYNNSVTSSWNSTLIKANKPEFRLAEPSKTLKNDINKNYGKNITNAPNLNNIFEFSPSMNNFLLQNNSSIFDYEYNLYNSEIYIDIVLLLLLVWFLNREFEIGYRLSFHSNVVANRDKARVQSMKNQADWLLHNIIPKHVADQLKQSAKYSENHKDVGILFASIVNFNEMYDESYMGGKEFLRVLNELIGDFDELLLRPEFRSVDKIKTIGSTFMAASGLNTQMRRESSNPNEHLFALMDFALEMQKVIDEFNRDLLEFNLVLRIGYNFGDVTAGVIGTSKLYYDIWGDAVNIASRMDTTGVSGRIQVGGACVPILQQRYEFEPRGFVYVKGKDNMNVFLLLRKKEIIASENIE